VSSSIQDFLSIHGQDRVAIHEVADLLAKPQGMDRNSIDVESYLLLGKLLLLNPGETRTPFGKIVRRNLVPGRGAELRKNGPRVALNSQIDARRPGDFLGIDVDHDESRGSGEPRCPALSEDIIQPGADDEDEIGLLECRRPGISEERVVILRNRTTPLRRRVERNAGGLDKTSQFHRCVRPNDAAARQDQRTL
jgi:hypothetical protein